MKQETWIDQIYKNHNGARSGGRRRKKEECKQRMNNDSYGWVTLIFYNQNVKDILVLSPLLRGVLAKTLGVQSNDLDLII